MTDPTPPEFQPEDAPLRWLQGGELLLWGLALLLFPGAWAVTCFAARGSPAADWLPHLMACAATILTAAGAALHSWRRWSLPTRRLCRLLPMIQRGEMPIESLSEIGGGLGPLAPIVRELLGELRRQRGEVKKLEHETRQRVASRTDALERALGSLKQKAARDPLTGLYNRRMLDEHLPHLIERHAARPAEQAGTPDAPATAPGGLSLLMIDVDHFKLLNDTLGHAAGDELLRCIGQLVRSSVRERDMAFRYGGDEFVILVDGAGDADARALADRLVKLVDGLTRPLRVPTPPRLSIGISRLCDLEEATPRALLREADRLLYEVKAARKAGPKQANGRGRAPAVGRAAG